MADDKDKEKSDIEDMIERVKGLPPEERVKALEELKNRREKEAKEVEKLINETITEIEDKSKEKVIEELSRLQEEIPEKKKEEETLEETAEKENVNVEEGLNVEYKIKSSGLPEEIYKENPGIYAVANKNVYGVVSNIVKKAEMGEPLTAEEEARLSFIEDRIRGVKLEGGMENDKRNYILRTEQLFDRIRKYKGGH